MRGLAGWGWALPFVAGCGGEVTLTCSLYNVPGVLGLEFDSCSANFEDGFREQNGGLYWLRLHDSETSGILDLYFPKRPAEDAFTLHARSDEYPEGGGTCSATGNVNAFEPWYSCTDQSGTGYYGYDGDLPDDDRPGNAFIEVRFDTPVTLSDPDGATTTLQGQTLVDVVGTRGGGGGGGGCGACDQDIVSACASPNELSYECYCTTSELYYCMYEAGGCGSDPQWYFDEAGRMDVAAEEIDTQGRSCPVL